MNRLTSLPDKLTDLSKVLLRWSSESISSLSRNLNVIKQRIEGIHRSPNYTNSLFLQNLESSLMVELARLQHQQEPFWRQLSRVQWISKGDAMPKFSIVWQNLTIGAKPFIILSIKTKWSLTILSRWNCIVMNILAVPSPHLLTDRLPCPCQLTSLLVFLTVRMQAALPSRQLKKLNQLLSHYVGIRL